MIDQEHACGKKVRYDSKSDARAARRRMMGQGTVKGKLTAYRCLYCHWWHLGHMPQSVRNGELNKQVWRRPA